MRDQNLNHEERRLRCLWSCDPGRLSSEYTANHRLVGESASVRLVHPQLWCESHCILAIHFSDFLARGGTPGGHRPRPFLPVHSQALENYRNSTHDYVKDLPNRRGQEIRMDLNVACRLHSSQTEVWGIWQIQCTQVMQAKGCGWATSRIRRGWLGYMAHGGPVKVGLWYDSVLFSEESSILLG